MKSSIYFTFFKVTLTLLEEDNLALEKSRGWHLISTEATMVVWPRVVAAEPDSKVLFRVFGGRITSTC